MKELVRPDLLSSSSWSTLSWTTVEVAKSFPNSFDKFSFFSDSSEESFRSQSFCSSVNSPKLSSLVMQFYSSSILLTVMSTSP